MAENLRRAYSYQFYFKSKAEYDKVKEHMRTDGQDALFYYDSESNLIYKSVSPTTGAWEISKYLYKDFADFTPSVDSNLATAYGFRTYYDNDSDLFSIGKLLKTNEVVFFEDSETKLKRVKVDGVGAKDSDFNTQSAYRYINTRLSKAKFEFSTGNMLDSDWDSVTDLALKLKVNGQNFPTASSQRQYHHTQYNGSAPPVIRLKKNGVNDYFTDLFSDINIAIGTERNITNGREYVSAVSDDSDTFTLGVDDSDYDRKATYKLYYETEMGDSEIDVEFPDFKVQGDSDLAPILTDSDDGLVSSFTQWAGEEAPWKVFSDSDNDGFKAVLGVESGELGWRDLYHLGYEHNLQRVIIKNTEAVPYNNQPYNFDIEGLTRPGTWEIVDQIRGFTDYVFDKTYADSDYLYIGYRISFKEGRPGFDPSVNALEVKQIKFVAQKETMFDAFDDAYWFGQRSGRGYYFTPVKDTTASALLVGGGGGGGSGNVSVGGGGGGGGYVRVDNMTFTKGHRYRIEIGANGNANRDGTASFITDLTANRVILYAGGGKRGSVGNRYATRAGGKGGQAHVWDSDGLIGFTGYFQNGGDGGTYGGLSNENPGVHGVLSTVAFYVNKARVRTETNYDMCSGGGSGAAWETGDDGSPVYNGTNNGATGNGESAGNGSLMANFVAGDATPGQHYRGGGGGGGGLWQEDGFNISLNGARGGQGYVFIHFE